MRLRVSVAARAPCPRSKDTIAQGETNDPIIIISGCHRVAIIKHRRFDGGRAYACLGACTSVKGSILSAFVSGSRRKPQDRVHLETVTVTPPGVVANRIARVNVPRLALIVIGGVITIKRLYPDHDIRRRFPSWETYNAPCRDRSATDPFHIRNVSALVVKLQCAGVDVGVATVARRILKPCRHCDDRSVIADSESFATG